MWAAPRDEHNRAFIVLMAALVALAWLALWAWGGSSGGPFYGHHGPDAFARGAAFAPVFVAGWTVMVVAMMLPTSLPLITLFRVLVRRRRDRALLVALLIAGYLVTWALFGVLVFFGGWALRLVLGQSAWLEANPRVLGAAIVTLAGLYQFTPLKHRCLEKCRSPLSFVMEHWRGRHEASHALRLGARHGLFCVGCCWSLMLLMFAVGAGSLGWMLALGAVMAVEKNVSWGRRIGAPLGAVLVGWGLLLGATQVVQPPGEGPAGVALVSADHSGASGHATFTDRGGGVEVRLDVRGLPDPGETYAATFRPGPCAGEQTGGDHAREHRGGTHDRHRDSASGGTASGDSAGGDSAGGDSAGGIEHPLTPVVSDPEGSGSSTTVIEDATVAELLAGGGARVSVRSGAPDPDGPPQTTLCGDLREPR